jgi:hypothetical protein
MMNDVQDDTIALYCLCHLVPCGPLLEDHSPVAKVGKSSIIISTHITIVIIPIIIIIVIIRSVIITIM